ncbi:HAMP domain-containing histidine kinase [Alteromonas sp. NFXS44]|uniref:sensor histidine kinase n=1 Tax=Alteromonas sp. NFXS44 TaxID=2818435 RepID=UPI0032DFEBF7
MSKSVTESMAALLSPDLLRALPVQSQFPLLDQALYIGVECYHVSSWHVSDEASIAVDCTGCIPGRQLENSTLSTLLACKGKNHWADHSVVDASFSDWMAQAGMADKVCSVYVIADEHHVGGFIVLVTQAPVDENDAGLTKLLDEFTPLLIESEYLKEKKEAAIEMEKLCNLGGMVATVAHEVNNPLGVAITSLSHLKESVDDLDKSFKDGTLTEEYFSDFIDDSNEVSDLLSFNLGRAAKLIRDFKTNAVNQSADVLMAFPLKSTIESVLSSVKPQLKAKQIEIVLDCQVADTFMMKGFPGALSQVLTNLLFNASIHAFDKSITSPKIHIRAESADGKATITFNDNGKGIPEAFREVMFEPYFTTRREEGGSGLGLHIVKNLTENKMQGQLTLQSEVGKGTEFVMVLPVEIDAE